MKTRIKIITVNNGNKFYYPEFRSLLFWWPIRIDYSQVLGDIIYTDNIDEAKAAINSMLEETSTTVEYLYYPNEYKD